MSQILWRSSAKFNGTQAALRWWKSAYGTQLPPRGFVWIVHGMGEHGGRYDELAKFLGQAGFDVLAPDLPGCGNTMKLGGQTQLPTIDEMVDELEAHFAWWISEGPLAAKGLAHTPWYLVGHSLGGLTALNWIVRGKRAGVEHDFAARAFVSAPPLKVKMPVPPWKEALARRLAKIAPNFKMSNGIDARDLSRDDAVVRAYKLDPLVHGSVSPRQYLSILETVAAVERGARDIEIPLFLSVGENDPIVDPKGVEELYGRLGTHKKLTIWPGAKHEILNELERSRLFSEVAAWFL